MRVAFQGPGLHNRHQVHNDAGNQRARGHRGLANRPCQHVITRYTYQRSTRTETLHALTRPSRYSSLVVAIVHRRRHKADGSN